jgi:outer membrane receptor protein involved in Fe transport
LQSQLLQPLNINPIQPQLSENKLLNNNVRSSSPNFSSLDLPAEVPSKQLSDAFDSIPPTNDRLASNTLGRASLNEYNTLFERNQFTFQGAGIISSNDGYGEELVLSGIWNKLSYSLSQLHLQNQSDLQTSGFEEDNSIKQNLYNAFVQYQVSNELNLQFEYRYDEIKNLGIENLLERNSTTSGDTSRHLYRIGANYQPDSTTNVLFSGIFTKKLDNFDRNSKEKVLFLPFDIEFSTISKNNIDSDSFSLELQYIKKLPWTKFILGTSYIYDNESEKEFFTDKVTISESGFLLQEQFSDQIQTLDKYNLNHTSVYLYSFTHYKNLNAILGVSFDLVDRRFQQNVKQFSPKLGLLWNITDYTVIRAAYFQGIKKRFNANQTIEPVQIAGFVQFLDSDSATGASYDQVGLGLDHKFNESLYFGLEGIYRQTKVPVPDLVQSFQGETAVLKVNINRKNEYSASSYTLRT